MDDSSEELLFVYGTLKQGFKNEVARYLHQTQSFLGKAHFPGQLFLVSFYPGAIYQPNADSSVYGDVFKIIHKPQKLFQVLDNYEGIGPHHSPPYEFERKIIPIQLHESIEQAQCYLYKGNHSAYPIIESGNFSLTNQQI